MNEITEHAATSATPTAAPNEPTAPAAAPTAAPTAEQVRALITAGHVRSALPPKPGHRPRGRPRKDGQPPRQTDSGRNAAAIATAAARHIATNPIDFIGTRENEIKRLITEPNEEEPTTPPARYADISIEKRIENLKSTEISSRARTFLQAFARTSHREAMKAAGLSAAGLWGMRNNPIFAEIYAELHKAHEAATIANTCDTLATLANGEYKPRTDCLPPDMRAASLLMPAIDPRFRPNSQTAAQQVQINISI